MHRLFTICLCFIPWLLGSCALLGDGEQNKPTVQRQLDTIEVRQQQAYLQQPYQPAEPRPMDLVHTKLELEPVWETASLKGKATLTITPTFYPEDSVVIDAHNFSFESLKLMDTSGGDQSLAYRYDTQKLVVQLPKTLKRNDTAKLFIAYTAHLGEVVENSTAIAGSKGIYFINPRGKIPQKPRQIWTQGETEYASHWFPTFDRPNEKTTQEVYITVDTAFTAISNGALIYNVTNPDGTHTAYWRQSKPHAPYLFMVAIGKYEKVRDDWRDSVPVNYYVEQQYAPYAKMIFGATPDMMTYYSNVLGFDYPWAKYAQVAVRDFIAGAMENTSATIHFSGIQQNKRQYLHRTYETLIAHELIHHWFGDLVTCESWANLAMNEAFATYGEHLWMKHAHGAEAAAIQWQNDRRRYLQEARRRKRPLIQYHYKSPGRLFDAHRYQKGACILRMLHKDLGDEAFFEGLSYFLKQHAYQPVEHHDLRLAFEHVTGRDLKWFFDQWFRSAGHPKLKVSNQYDSARNEVLLTVKQEHNTAKYPVFQLPMTIGIHHRDGKVKQHEITIQNKVDSFRFAAKQPPHLVNFDANKAILAEKDLRFDLENWIYQFHHTQSYLNQYEAITHISRNLSEQSPAEAVGLTRKALNSPFWRIRQVGLGMVQDTAHENFATKFEDKVKNLALSDPETRVRGYAFLVLASYDNPTQFLSTFKKGLKDSAYYVVGKALEALKNTKPQLALKASRQLKDTRSDELLYQVAKLHAQEGSKQNHQFLQSLLLNKPGWEPRFQFVSGYLNYLKRMGPTFFKEQVPQLEKLKQWVAKPSDRKSVLKALKNHQARLKEELSEMEKESAGQSGKVTLHENLLKTLDQVINAFEA